MCIFGLEEWCLVISHGQTPSTSSGVVRKVIIREGKEFSLQRLVVCACTNSDIGLTPEQCSAKMQTIDIVHRW